MGTDTFLPNGGLPATGTQRSGFPLFSSRLVTLLAAGLALLVLIAILIAAALLPDSGLGTQLDARIQPPSWAHPFGTDTLGRDMLTRTIKGLAVSMRVGMLASIGATLIAIALGVLSALNFASLLTLDTAMGSRIWWSSARMADSPSGVLNRAVSSALAKAFTLSLPSCAFTPLRTDATICRPNTVWPSV